MLLWLHHLGRPHHPFGRLAQRFRPHSEQTQVPSMLRSVAEPQQLDRFVMLDHHLS